jgi:6-phosphogluconolactonase
MIAAALIDTVSARDRVHWATTGGSTPAAIYRNLATPPLRDRVPWEFVELWWGDERFVPPDHPLSNAKIALSDLLEIGALSGQSGTGGSGVDVTGRRTAGAPIPAENVHPIPTGRAIAEGFGPEWAAERYVETLQAQGPPAEGRWPVFDLVLLGIGPDGHVLSVFPGSDTFDREEVAMAVPAPTHVEPHVARVTLNPRILGVARRIIVVSHGAAKAPILAEVLGPERDERRWPAQLARRAGATWVLDEAAASALRR